MALSVIGAGFGRTGTLSLKAALEMLGVGRCYHMVEIIANPQFAAAWEQAADGGPVDWDQIFAGYGATVDWPAAAFYRELAEYYPKARVILTVRDSESWFESTQNTIFSPLVRQRNNDMAGEDRGRMAEKIIIDGTFQGQQHDKETAIAVYEAHNRKVREVIAPERLLVYNVAEGWTPLCKFLGYPIPDAAFPKVNSTDEFRQMFGDQPTA